MKKKTCSKCSTEVEEKDARVLRSEILCEDCYIDEFVPRMGKSHYENDAEFMQRLKESYTVRPQKFH